METDVKENESIRVIISHSLTRSEYLDYLFSISKDSSEYRKLAEGIVTPHSVVLETYSNKSLMLQRYIKSFYEDVDATLRIVLNDFEFIFKPLSIERFFTIVLTFKNNNYYNKFKIQHPNLYEKSILDETNGIL